MHDKKKEDRNREGMKERKKDRKEGRKRMQHDTDDLNSCAVYTNSCIREI